jgi:hypothetical protein
MRKHGRRQAVIPSARGLSLCLPPDPFLLPFLSIQLFSSLQDNLSVLSLLASALFPPDSKPLCSCRRIGHRAVGGSTQRHWEHGCTEPRGNCKSVSIPYFTAGRGLEEEELDLLDNRVVQGHPALLPVSSDAADLSEDE